MNIIETKNIEKTYKTGDEVVEALKDVNLTLTEGEILAIMGFLDLMEQGKQQLSI